MPTPIQVDLEKMHMKCLALNIDFDGSSLDFLGLKKPVHEGIKEWYPHKSHYFTVVNQSFVKTVATSTSDELFSHINIDYFERPLTFIIRGFY